MLCTFALKVLAQPVAYLDEAAFLDAFDDPDRLFCDGFESK
jgi:hypothetical protein